ncbi:MAG: holo-[acyl-carrier protein] synthase [Thermoleophilaceae bacterium]|nr:holo-[acyl-carrier protein] synthase [Thermoleophilaceae bacterium]
MIGIDVLEVERLERALERRPNLLSRLFTLDERAYAAAHARPALHLAARFCAKEAVAKALALDSWAFTDVEVVATGTAPEVRLTGAAAERAAQLGAHPRISLTHTRETAAAVAILA